MSERSEQGRTIDTGRFLRPGRHPESLLRLSLVEQLFQDEVIRICPRRIDRRWYYEKIVPVSLSGFNPSSAQVYYSEVSAFADWLKEPHGSARRFNEGDFLVPEVLFAAHDYLHAWSYQVINEITPDIEFGYGEITRDNAEAMVFCHLLTEAVATAGLDYWYLSQFDLNTANPIGTCLQQLTVSYSSKHRDEFRRFHPDLQVESPQFMVELADFYCNGVFKGFSRQDLKDSPLLLRWLQHEIGYGAQQREYTRMWLQHLSPNDLGYGAWDSLSCPVEHRAPWMRDLLTELSRRVWAKVVDDDRRPTPRTIPSGAAWKSGKPPREFRFTNLGALTVDEIARFHWSSVPAPSIDYYLWQYVSQFEYDSIDPEARQLLPRLRGQRDVSLVRWMFRNAQELAGQDAGSRDIFLIN